MTEYVTNLDLYVLADSQSEAETITERLIAEIFDQPEVVAVNAQTPEAM